MRLFIHTFEFTHPDYYLSHDNEHATWLRILEAAASIRFLKLCRYYEGAGLLVRALSKSVEQLFVPLFMLSIMVICFSTILYEVEYDRTIHDYNSHWLAQNVSAAFLRARPAGVAWSCDVCTTDFSEIVGSIDEGREQCNTCNGYPDGHPECVGVPFGQQFPNIPACMWFMVVTITTVGYGDSVPQSAVGQVFTVMVILLGVVFIAMPIATVGNTFKQVWDERQLVKLQALTRQLLSENGISPDDCREAFMQFDTDGNGLVDATEFTFFVTNVLGLRLRKSELNALWKMLDLNGSGAINFHEFTSALYPESAMNVVQGNELTASAVASVSPGPSPSFIRKERDDKKPPSATSFNSGTQSHSFSKPVSQLTSLGLQVKAFHAATTTQFEDIISRVNKRTGELENLVRMLLPETAPSGLNQLMPRPNGLAGLNARSRRHSFSSILPVLGISPPASNENSMHGTHGLSRFKKRSASNDGSMNGSSALARLRSRRNSWSGGGLQAQLASLSGDAARV